MSGAECFWTHAVATVGASRWVTIPALPETPSKNDFLKIQVHLDIRMS
jgi:hypothetical protein